MKGEIAIGEYGTEYQGDNYAEDTAYELLEEHERYDDSDYCDNIVFHWGGIGVVNSIGRWVTG